jgi:hypothetical protein
VNFPWLICLARQDAAALATVRLTPGLEVAETEEHVWVRGHKPDERVAAQLKGLPALHRYEVTQDNYLRRIDERIPRQPLPQFKWQPLQHWLQVKCAPAALPAQAPDRSLIVLVRSFDERAPDLLLVSLNTWLAFAEVASEVRLQRLSFAANDRGEVLVRGQPLPPLPGERYVLLENIAVPAGYRWEPAVAAGVVAHCFGVPASSIALWRDDGTVEQISAEQFIPATRSAARSTAEELLRHEGMEGGA